MVNRQIWRPSVTLVILSMLLVLMFLMLMWRVLEVGESVSSVFNDLYFFTSLLQLCELC